MPLAKQTNQGKEQVLPIEVFDTTLHTSALLDQLNDQMIRHTLVETEKKIEATLIHLELFHKHAARYYNISRY